MAVEPFDENKASFMKELEKLRPDLMYADIWSEGDRQWAAEEFRPAKVKSGMLSSIPMRCRAEKCFVADMCPLVKKGIAPEGKPCPIEQSLVLQFFNDYVDELNVDTNRMVEVSMVRDLVDQEIQQMRKTWLLSQEHFIQENVAGVDSEGNVVLKKELHQAIDYEERILKRKEKLRNALLATRESKAKTGQTTMDNAQLLAQLMADARQVELDSETPDEYSYMVEDAEIVEDED